MQSLETFLRSLEHGSETSTAVSCFADTFLAAGPNGVTVVKATELAAALPHRKKMFEEMGCRSATLDSVSETKLDDRYTLAEAKWRMTFARNEAQTAEFLVGSTYIMDTSGERKILFYLTHQDIKSLLHAEGML
ncbi:MAG: hypothetical protein JOZ83_06285 [Silvibacterium sp.]|nr:hypothetical protein [Silvibacterium sp.]